MQKKQVVKKLLAVSAVAAMFSAFGVQAQTSGQSAQSMTNQTATGNPNLTGKTAADGTVNNTSSQGTEDRSAQTGAQGSSGSQGTTRAEGAKSHTMDSGSMQSGASGTAGATGSGAAKLSAADRRAINDMALANMAEIETGKLALSKSQNPDVKTFAQQMIDDHGKALTEVQALAQQKGVTLPTALDPKHKAISAKLEKLNGEAFDREYMKSVGVADHKQTHDKLQKGVKNAKDPDVKALAAKLMPTVEQHLKAAQQMSSAKSGTTSGK